MIGVPHPLKGQEIKAFVVPQEGQSPDKQELLRFLRGRLTNYKLPEKVVFTEDPVSYTHLDVYKRQVYQRSPYSPRITVKCL